MNDLAPPASQRTWTWPAARSKSQFKLADRAQADYALIVGESELKNQTVQIKDLIAREQITIPRADALDRLRRSLLGLVNVKVMSPAERAACTQGQQARYGAARVTGRRPEAEHEEHADQHEQEPDVIVPRQLLLQHDRANTQNTASVIASCMIFSCDALKPARYPSRFPGT